MHGLHQIDLRLRSLAVAEFGDVDRGNALAALRDDGFVVLRALLSDAELAAAREQWLRQTASD